MLKFKDLDPYERVIYNCECVLCKSKMAPTGFRTLQCSNCKWMYTATSFVLLASVLETWERDYPGSTDNV